MPTAARLSLRPVPRGQQRLVACGFTGRLPPGTRQVSVERAARVHGAGRATGCRRSAQGPAVTGRLCPRPAPDPPPGEPAAAEPALPGHGLQLLQDGREQAPDPRPQDDPRDRRLPLPRVPHGGHAAYPLPGSRAAPLGGRGAVAAVTCAQVKHLVGFTIRMVPASGPPAQRMLCLCPQPALRGSLGCSRAASGLWSECSQDAA